MKVFILLSILFLVLFAPGMLAECLTDVECQQAFDVASPPRSEDFQRLAFPTPEDFQRLENPTEQDLQRLPEPSFEDFQRLDDGEQRRYIQDSSFGRKDQEIAAKYFSDASNINRDKRVFSKYARTMGMDLSLQGNVREYSPDGLLQGRDATGRSWSINILNPHIQNTYSLSVERSGDLVMMRKLGEETISHKVSGDITADDTAEETNWKLRIADGTIDGREVRNARDISFAVDGGVLMIAKEFDGLVFADEGAVALEEDGHVQVRTESEIQAFKEGHRVYIEGAFTVSPEHYGDIQGELLLRGQIDYDFVRVNGMKIFPVFEDTMVVFQPTPIQKNLYLESLTGPLPNRIIFTPRQVAVEGMGEGGGPEISVGHDFLRPFTDGAVRDRRAGFSMRPQNGRVLMEYDQKEGRLHIAAQGSVLYVSGPQRLVLQNDEINRHFVRSTGAILAVPVDLEYYNDDGDVVGEIYQSDYSSYTSEGRRVLSSMGSSFGSLGVLKDIATGDPEKIYEMNDRIEKITWEWDDGQLPSTDELDFLDAVYKAMMAGSRVTHGSVPARSLYHYLEATGEPLDYDADLFLERPEVQYAMGEMQQHIVEKVLTGSDQVRLTSTSVPDLLGTQEESSALERVEESYFGKVEDGVIWTPDRELRYSFGNFYLKADARREGGDIIINWAVDDRYDYERNSGKDIVIPTGQLQSALDKVFRRKQQPVVEAGIVPGGRSGEEPVRAAAPSLVLPDRLSAYLPDVGRAREFDMRARWRTRCTQNGRCMVEED